MNSPLSNHFGGYSLFFSYSIDEEMETLGQLFTADKERI